MKLSLLVLRSERAFAAAFAIAAFLVASILGRAANENVPVDLGLNPPFTAIHVLGDSLSDTGRTSQVLTAVLGQPFPPPPYASGRMSNGPLWIEYFSPMFRRPYNFLDNFSWAGANTGSLNVFPGLPGMAQELAELLASAQGQLDPKALYVVFGGSNDFLRILSPNPEDPAVVISQGVANLLHIVGTLRAAGALHIVVVDLPDIGRTPRALAAGPGNSAAATYLSTLFNQFLNQGLDALPFQVVRVSMFNLLNDFVAHPQKYGFANVTSPGILDLANANSYLFWDDVHPTTRGHRHVAEEIYQAVVRAGLMAHQP